jgi:hypothetical protein
LVGEVTDDNYLVRQTRSKVATSTKPAASGSTQSCVVMETPARATDQLSAKPKLTLRGFPFKVAVSDVEEFSVMTRLLITLARSLN